MEMGELYTFKQLQDECREWRARNFPESSWEDQFMGVVEEVGEMSHALLKQKQGVRGTSEYQEGQAMDAVGDLLIFLTGLCDAREWSLQDIVEETWAKVRKRDWVADPHAGGDTELQ